MAQQINDNFQLLAGLPIDDRNRKSTIAERDAISATRRFQGLQCFVEQTQTLYQLTGGILNSNWVGIAGNNSANELETVIEGFYVLSSGKTTLLDWEVGDKFRGWIGDRYVVGSILSLPVSLPEDIDNSSKVFLALDSDNLSGDITTDTVTNETTLPGSTASDAFEYLNENKANDENVIHTTGNETKSGILNIIDKIQFGTVKTTYGIALAISKNITNSNLHIIDDYSVINASSDPADGYGIFDASTEMTGTSVYDHFNAYQSRLKYSGSGSINPFYGLNGFFVDNSHTGTGLIKSHHGIYINDIGGTGPVTDNVGLYIRPITRGTRNFAIDSEGGASRFRGDIFNLNAKGFYSFSVGQLGDANTNFSAFFNNHDTLFYTGATGTETAGDFVFGKIQDGAQTGLMRITHDGKLGLNTNTPHATADITTSIKSNSLIFNADSGLIIGSNIRQLSINSSDTAGVYDMSLQARTNSNTASALRLNPLGGNVLIGNLAGTGTRLVVADASGNLSATDVAPTSGGYTPTTSSLVNMSSLSGVSGMYSRIGNIITVTIRFLANESAANTQTSFVFTLPVNRTGSTASNNFGTGNVQGASGVNKLVTVNFNATTDTATVLYSTLSSFGSSYGSATFQYDVTQ